MITLRSFGVGKRTFEENIAEEAKCFTKEIKSLNGEAFDPRQYFPMATSNVICAVVFGKRFVYSDAKFKRLMYLLDELVALVGAGALILFFPSMRYLMPSTYAAMKQNRSHTTDIVTDIIEQHKKDRVPNEPNDYIDAYLDEIDKNRKHGSTRMNETTLKSTLRSLFAGGTETTATTLQWAVQYMVAFPEIQNRVQRELDSVVGRNRLPRLADKADLSFTCATLLEIQRFTSVAPLGLVHACGEDTTLGPYFIPKEAVVLSNLWSIHHDPEVWTNPDEFNPQRFLDDYGNIQEKDELIPFSIGTY